MQTANNTRSSLFLIELIIDILFFSLGSAVCIQAVVKAHSDRMDARALSFASSTVSSAASVVKYTDGELDSVQAYFPGAFLDSDSAIAVCYDGDFTPCAPEDAAYILRIETASQEETETAHIWMDGQEGQLLYELDLRYPRV